MLILVVRRFEYSLPVKMKSRTYAHKNLSYHNFYSLSDITIGTHGAKDLASGLKVNKSLTYLRYVYHLTFLKTQQI